jgi:DNA helicase-2/ATP-dependent DNA helicase PcrA
MENYLLRARTGSAAHFKIAYEQELNPAQLEVACALDGPVLVIAGAGSGKTRTLIYRLARLVETGVPAENILLLTFTRKSAQEMIKRAGVLLGSACDQVAGGTFHSVANFILRRYGRAIGLEPSFTILDRGDSEDLINLLRTQLGLGQADRRFPRKQTIAEIFSKSVNKLEPLERIIEQDYAHFLDATPELLRLQQLYAQQKRDRGLLDYDDLLARWVELMEQQPEIRERLSRWYRFVMVDEYQDTNRLQARVIRLLCSAHQNIMVVGDDAQSIYSFRGAHFRNIIDFPNEFPGARLFKLEENYRSTQPILDLTNEVLRQAREQFSKTLFTSRSGGPPPVVVRTETENHQSRFVCQKILELYEEGVPLGEIAVLFRSSFHSFDLEIELARHNLPFVKRGGFKFLEAAHIKDVLAHLRVLANPRDHVSWTRLLLLIDGVGPKRSQAIIAALAGAAEPIEALARLAGEKSGAGLRPLAAALTSLRAAGRPPDQLERLYNYYLPVLQQRFDDYPKRAKDLDHLLSMAQRYADPESFLADVALEPPDESVSEVAGTHPDERVVLTTIHSAKGLEWHTVFIIWALDGRFPSLYSVTTDDELDEERRLFYVAATRAKQNLFITYPINVYDKTVGMVLTRPSRFLEEIPTARFALWNVIEAPQHDRL